MFTTSNFTPEAMKKNIPFVLILLAPIFPLEAKIQQVDKVAAQPLILQVKHLREALQYLGEPLPSSTVKQLETATKTKAAAQVTKIVQAALDPFTLSVVNINPESRVKVNYVEVGGGFGGKTKVYFAPIAALQKSQRAQATHCHAGRGCVSPCCAPGEQ